MKPGDFHLYAKVSESDRDYVSDVARQLNRTVSSIVREAINDWLEREGRRLLDEPRVTVAAGRSSASGRFVRAATATVAASKWPS